MLANVPRRTGKSLEAWIALVRAQGSSSHKQLQDWLVQEHGLTNGYAGAIVYTALLPDDYVPPSDEELVDAQYTGGKAALRPIYERIIACARALGGDVMIEPRKTYVSLSRGKQFALVAPSTRTRVDLGLYLPGVDAAERLQPAGSFGSGQTSHKVALTAPEQVDDEVAGWLRSAYELAYRG
jgi:hypothetical protein